MSDYSFKAISKTTRDKGKEVTGEALDDYFGRHQYGYRIKGKQRVYNQEQFDKYYQIQKVKGDEGIKAFMETIEGAPETIDDVQEREFIVTDACMWEANRKNGTFHPHAIEVVDLKTGQTRYIESGAVIKFVEGKISNGRDQASYNEHHK